MTVNGIVKIILIEKDEEEMKTLQTTLQNSGLNIHILNALDNIHSLKTPIVLAADVIIFDRNDAVNVLNEVIVGYDLDCPIILTGYPNEKADLPQSLNIIGLLKKPFQRKEIIEEIQRFIKLRNHFFSLFKKLLDPVIENNAKKKSRFIIRKGREHSVINTNEIAYFFNENGLNYIVDKWEINFLSMIP